MKINKLLTGKRPRFSLLSLVVFVGIFILTGAYMLYRVYGAPVTDALKSELYSPTGKTIERVWGPDRYSTAVGISKKQFPTTKGGTVIIVGGDAWPDATSGSVLARSYDAPILLTQSSTLNSNTESELKRLAPVRILILGGTSTVSSTTENKIRTVLPSAKLERISGSTRYETAAKIGDRIYQINGSKLIITQPL